MRLLRIIFYVTVIGLLAIWRFGTFSSDLEEGNLDIHIGEDTQVVDLSDQPFQQLSLSGLTEVELVQGDVYRLEVSSSRPLQLAGKNLVEAGVLRLNSGSLGGAVGNKTIRVTMPQLDRIEISGTAELYSKGTFRQKKLDIQMSGSSDIRLDLEAEELTASLGGASDLNVSGIAHKAEYRIIGVGDLRARDLDSKSVKIDISGAGDAWITATEELHAKVWGAGEIRYAGDPSSVIQEVSGAGSVEKD
jgi:hypothetical protein